MSEAGVLKFAENGLLADISSMYGEGRCKATGCTDLQISGNACCLFRSKRGTESVVQH